MNFNTLKITPQQAESLIQELFDVSGKATPLPGYLDFNFRIKVDDGEGYILKISRPDEDVEYLDFQQKLLQYAEKKGRNLISPHVILDTKGNPMAWFTDDAGNRRIVRLLTWISGRIWSAVNPQLDDLRFSLGAQCGKLTQALQGFDHPQAHREFEWDIARSLWTTAHLDLFDEKERRILHSFQKDFEKMQSSYATLRKAVVHNDANDNNLIVSEDLVHPTVKAAIDYGDALHTQIINDLAIACAYAIMGHNIPLEAALPIVKGYHSEFPLEERELKHLYNAIAMRLVISVIKSAMNKREEPDNAYLLVSEKPAWEVLEKWYAVDADFAHYSFRQACEFVPHPLETKFEDWAGQNEFRLLELFPKIDKNQAHPLDLGVSSKWLGQQEDFDDLELFQFKVARLAKQHPEKIMAGGYLEPRTVYTTSEYGRIGNSGTENRSIHLGLDFWLPAGTAVNALFDGEVVTSVNDAGDKEYGGLIILKHKTDSFEFYTLYGHLSVASIQKKEVGQSIKKGENIGNLGDPEENGNWAPHLHFQIMLSMLGYTTDFPGVGYFNQIEVWKSVCPDPNLLFKSESLRPHKATSNDRLIKYRKQHLGKSLSLHYKVPIKMVRGAGQYLIDQHGRKYLDTVNNVAHVGHEHPAVVKAGQEQMALLNTNSRYLHDNINALTQELLETLPPELSVLHFVNSGSEANELAIRMVKAVTGERDIIASEVGYHGNTNMTVDISSYKFDGKGGQGAPEHTHIFPLPDAFRGKYRGENTGDRYAAEVQLQIDAIHRRGRGVGALIVEPIISCGGQIELPEGFLAKAYQYVRAAGGLCISDEVQVGCGRVGKYFWGFQLHDVVPDIVTIGKPLGNGHPLAAVACTHKVAEKFANGMEYFNTFGGNPVSCAIGTEVLRTVKRENLQEHALKVGEFLKSGLKKLAENFPIIGDVRGQGLFLGFELVDAEMNPLGDKADYLANRMKHHGILMSSDGPDHNVLKIKPPMVFSKENAEELLFYLGKVFGEDFMRSNWKGAV
ncbi:aminotransferase class III-fold pyridoxal phosphate-dependent enzyme [Pricia sp.]|uniref:aminotransferase class III-fold pyridoxal phosphate-dependent enzyme n=1 Tax=Pricia sp. TaxID=2268138 RepID=UPI00359408EC